MKLRPVHRARRFASSLVGGRPSAADMEWAEGHLNEGERRYFGRMSAADQRHAIAVARDAEAGATDLPDDQRALAVPAALLHDVGKIAAGLGTYGRAVATLSGVVAGPHYADAWQERSGFTRKVGLYLKYGDLGAEMLQLAGSDPVVVAWSREHHFLPEDWTVPAELGTVLAAADR